MAERPRELGDFKKARVNVGTDNDSLKDSHKSLRCRWQTRIIMVMKPFVLLRLAAKYRSRRWMGVINIAADHQMFMTLTGEL